MHRRAQGDLGEASAIEWLASRGALIFTPPFHSPDYDLVAEMGGRLVRVEVKTSSRRTPIGNWEIALCTRGGNQSWSGLTKRFDARRCDYLFALVGDGRRWFIPGSRIEGATSIVVGGRKYGTFEVEPGRPLPVGTVENVASTIASP